MNKIDLCASTIDGDYLFRGDSVFVPRIGEKVTILNDKYIVEDVETKIVEFGFAKVFLRLKEI